MPTSSLAPEVCEERIETRLLTPDATCRRCDGVGGFWNWQDVGNGTSYMVRRCFRCPCIAICPPSEVMERLADFEIPLWLKETLAQLWMLRANEIAENARLLWRIASARVHVEAEIYRVEHGHYPDTMRLVENSSAKG
ncbi:hypothetical protein [Kozakia baliensis]|uniref:hypothetical protein n=1 Tax=Kozakia baliensis TaxID=153496 RepID=UPI00087AF669|nr:hypothetical protein [Kozakia baliensis]AOX21641.1 hypothetical protein A0U90_14155 [Kozakia baliensis]